MNMEKVDQYNVNTHFIGNTDYYVGVPVAWLISDKEDSTSLECFLQAVKVKSPSTEVTTALTDDGKLKRTC